LQNKVLFGTRTIEQGVKTEQGKLNRQDYQVRVGSQGGFLFEERANDEILHS